ncbi:MAG: helix-turn-helix domain-containing protein [Lachnospiraceae bacterium]|nr:helix-turn-helix domain-containing protein [Lachnospiraceae bacterium]
MVKNVPVVLCVFGLKCDTVAVSKGASVTTDVLCKICEYLDCQPSDIIEYTKE